MPEPAEDSAPPVSPVEGDQTAPPRAPRAPRFDLKGFVRQNQRLAGAVVMLVLGIVFVMLGWYGAANTNIFTEQIPYLISGGLLGLGLIIVAGFLAASASLERKTDLLREDLIRALGSLPSGGGASGLRTASGESAVYVLPGGHSYHLAGCPILEGKTGVEQRTARAAIADGHGMCKLCGPE